MASVFPGSDIFLEKVFWYAAHTESGTNIWAENIFENRCCVVLSYKRNASLIPEFKYSDAVGSGDGKDGPL